MLTILLLLQKHGWMPVLDVDIWLWIFAQARRAKFERDYIADARADYA